MDEITDKKNQHYVPKFYLRNFSYEGNKKQIGIYNINNSVYVQRAKLKTQASKNFFYGYDGVIEDNLSNIESSLAVNISKIIEGKTLPAKNTPAHFDLLLFTTVTDNRNPVKIEGTKDMLAEIKKRTLEQDPNADVDTLLPTLSHDEVVTYLLTAAFESALMILDLDYKLLINRTSRPFISSDFPITKYNQYLEYRKWNNSKSGYGLTGLQIFIPLNHEIALVFFDAGIYKVGDKKKNSFLITNETDVDQLNCLQFLNCLETVYFNERADQAYIKTLHRQSEKYRRANQTRSEMSFLIKENDEQNKKLIDSGFKNLIMVNKSDCETNLAIEGMKIHSKGHEHKLHDSMAQLRPYVIDLQNKQKSRQQSNPNQQSQK